MSWFSWSLHCSLINIEPGTAAKHNPANNSHHSRENTSTFLKLIGSIMAQFTSREKKQEDSNLSFTDQFNMSFWHSSGLQLPVQLMSVGIKVLTWASRGGKCCCCKICPMWLRVKELRKCEKGDLKGQEEWQMISYVNSRKWNGNRKERPRGGLEMMVVTVKTSDDSLCPLCGDCSLINLEVEILPPWAKMRKDFLFLLLLLLYIFRCWLDEMRGFL